MRKIVGVEDALAGVDDGSVIAVSGFNNALTPEYLLLKLYETWERTGHPRRLFLESDSLPGVDIDRDVLGAMDFRPSVSPMATQMDPRLLRDGAQGGAGGQRPPRLASARARPDQEQKSAFA